MDFDPRKPSSAPVSKSGIPDKPEPEKESSPGNIAGYEVKPSSTDVSLSQQLEAKPSTDFPVVGRVPTLRTPESYFITVAAGSSQASAALMVMIKHDLIPLADHLTSKAKEASKKMPKDKHGILRWVSQNTFCANAALYAGIIMMKSKASLVKEIGENAIMCATIGQEKHCVGVVNLWLALQCLNERERLTDADHNTILKLFNYARLYNLPTGRWMHGLRELGLVNKLLPGDMASAIDSLLVLSSHFEPLPEELQPVGYRDEPVVFGELDGLTRVQEEIDLDFVKGLSLSDPQCFYRLMPVIIAANLGLPSSKFLLKQLGAVPNTPIDPVTRLIHYAGVGFHLLFLLRKKTILPHRQKIQDAKKKHKQEQRAELIGQFSHPFDRPGKSAEFMAQYVDVESRKIAVQVKEELSSLIDGDPKPCPELKALLLVELGKLYEMQLVKSEKPLAKACEYYQQACRLMPSAEFVKSIETLLVKGLEYAQVAEFLKTMKPVMGDSSYIELRIKQYEQTADMFRHWSTKVSQETINQLFAELGLADEPAPRSRKKTKKKAEKKTAPQDSPAPDDSTASVSVSDVPDVIPEATPTLPGAKPTARAKIKNLLTWNWSPNVFRVLRIALDYRYDAEDYEQERKTLVRGIEKWSGMPGCERLHEELAWHYIRQQRDTMKLLSEAKEDIKKLQKNSKELLSSAERQLFIALGRKLQVSDADASRLYASGDWEAVAESISERFENDEERHCYRNGIGCIMSSLGHVASERAQHLSTGPTAKSTEAAQKGYAGKSFKS